MWQLAYLPPAGVALNGLHFEPIKVVIEHGGSLFGERGATIIFLFPHRRSVIALARSAK